MAGVSRGGNRTKRRGVLAAMVLGLLAVAVSGCSTEDAWRLGIPEAMTTQGESIEGLWFIAVVAAAIVGGLTYFLILFAMVAYRKRSEDLPTQVQYHIPIEVIYTVVPFLIVVGLMYATVVSQNDVLDEDPNPDVSVTVTGLKWNWRFTYDDAQAPSGDPVTTIGTTAVVPVLVLPTDESVKVNIQSEDVNHSFWVPDFLFKRDAIPGRTSSFQYNITQEGAYVGHCAELCGAYHAFMNFEVRAVSPADFDTYLAARERGLTNPEALIEIGQEPLAQTTEPLDGPAAATDSTEEGDA